MNVLVINSGSSSVKYELFDMSSERSVLSGIVERVEDHAEALSRVIEAVKAEAGQAERPDAVGHRVVHGGERFVEPVVIDDEVLAEITGLARLAPLHTGPNITGINVAREHLPRIPHVAVFDTAFHATMPAHAREYALPRKLCRAHGVRRYGFHGTSHAYVARRAAEFLGRPLEELNLITLHLGAGASVTAIRGGKSVDTSMGMTPLEGLVMGTRCGDVDPAVPLLLARLTGSTREQVHHLLNRESGLLGLCGERDMREVHRLADGGDGDAELALEMFCYRAKKYIGAYHAILGRVDGVVFTAGIGENDAKTRARICDGLGHLGIEVDAGRNTSTSREDRVISPSGAGTAVFVVPTDEEREIARQVVEVAGLVTSMRG